MNPLSWLNSFQNYERLSSSYPYREAFSLERIRGLLVRLGDPHLRCPSLHVAGTKGKGSTCAFAASILSASGLRTGLYTSPHLFSFHERIQVDGVPINDQELTAAAERVRLFADPELTYFEVATACAFVHFALRGVDAVVAEVGLGGRLDATNTLTPMVTAITPVSMDHVTQLGPTLREIAGEKAGIIKTETPVVMAPQHPDAEAVIRETALRHRATVHPVAEEVQAEAVRLGTEGTVATLRTPVHAYPDLRIPLLGRHQVDNCAAAIRMAELLAGMWARFKLTPEAVREGVSRASWPVRCQWVPGSPPVLLDGAQNEASARALIEAANDLFPGRKACLVIGCSIEKELEGMARVWGPHAAGVVATRAGSPRAEDPRKLADAFRSYQPGVRVVEPVARAVEEAQAQAGPEGLVVVTGSLFVVAEALASAFSSGAGPGTAPPQPPPKGKG